MTKYFYILKKNTIFAVIIINLAHMFNLQNYLQLGACTLILIIGLFFTFWRFEQYDKLYKTLRYAVLCHGILLIIWSVFYLEQILFPQRLESNAILNASLNIARFAFVTVMLKNTMISFVSFKYPILKRVRESIIHWIIFSLLMIANALYSPAIIKMPLLIAAAVSFICYIAYAVFAFDKVYKKNLEDAKQFYAYDIEIFVKWIKRHVHYLSILGISATVHSLFPNYFGVAYLVVIFIFFIAMSFSLVSFVNLVGKRIKDISADEEPVQRSEIEDKIENAQIKTETLSSAAYGAIKISIEKWILEHGYIDEELTIVKLARELDTNRTYLSTYIRQEYGTNFRDWIADLRLDYSKQLLLDNPDLPANKVGLQVGYSANHFVVIFTQKHGMSPGQWRKQNLRS